MATQLVNPTLLNIWNMILEVREEVPKNKGVVKSSTEAGLKEGRGIYHPNEDV